MNNQFVKQVTTYTLKKVIGRFAEFLSVLSDQHGIDRNVLYEAAVKVLVPFNRDEQQQKALEQEVYCALVDEVLLVQRYGREGRPAIEVDPYELRCLLRGIEQR